MVEVADELLLTHYFDQLIALGADGFVGVDPERGDFRSGGQRP